MSHCPSLAIWDVNHTLVQCCRRSPLISNLVAVSVIRLTSTAMFMHTYPYFFNDGPKYTVSVLGTLINQTEAIKFFFK